MSKVMYTVAIQNRFAGLVSDDESEKDGSISTFIKNKQSSINNKTENKSTISQQPLSAKEVNLQDQKKKNKKKFNNKGEFSEAPIGDTKSRGQKIYQRNKLSHAEQRDKRIFDRRSGTGRGKEMKKSGACGYNWGNDALDYRNDRLNNDTNFQQNNEAVAETEKISIAKDCTIDYSEYQKLQKIKRANLLEKDTNPIKNSDNLRSVNLNELSEAGFEKYEREIPDSKNNRSSPPIYDKVDESEEESMNRQRAVNINDFGKHLIKSKRYRDKKLDRDEKLSKSNEINKPNQENIVLNLQDMTVFPSLA